MSLGHATMATRSTTAGTGSETTPILSVQILRAIAALAVLLYHICIESATRLGPDNLLPRFDAGAAGVDLFFVISGFVIVYSSASLFGRGGAPRVFFERRLMRIVPLYWAATAAAILCFVVLKYKGSVADLTFEYIAASLLFIPYQRSDGLMLPVHILGWTLNYEMFFYAVFAFALAARARAAVVGVTALFAAMWLANVWLGPFPQPFAFWCDAIILEFGLGAFIGLACLEGWRMPRAFGFALIIAGTVAFLASAHPLFAGLPRLVRWGIPAGAIMTGIVLGQLGREGGRAARFLAALGDASYALYLVHLLVILVLASAVVRLHIVFGPWGFAYAAALAVASIAAAVLVHRWFERPVMAALRAHGIGAPSAAKAETAAAHSRLAAG
jgi:peptidoglycan/LPS O-acetylase OafA/YrhL